MANLRKVLRGQSRMAPGAWSDQTTDGYQVTPANASATGSSLAPWHSRRDLSKIPWHRALKCCELWAEDGDARGTKFAQSCFVSRASRMVVRMSIALWGCSGGVSSAPGNASTPNGGIGDSGPRPIARIASRAWGSSPNVLDAAAASDASVVDAPGVDAILVDTDVDPHGDGSTGELDSAAGDSSDASASPTCAAETPVLHVADFGAHPDDSLDDRAAFMAAFSAAQHCDRAKIQLGSGVYRIEFDSGRAHLVLQGTVDITLVGTDTTELRFVDPTKAGLALADNTNIAIENVTLDYESAPYTQGSIVEFDPNLGYFDVELDEGFALLSAPHFSSAPHRFGYGAIRAVDYRFAVVFPLRWESQGGRVFRLYTAGAQDFDAAGIAVGKRYVQIAGQFVAATVVIDSNDSAAVRNVRVHSSPAAASLWMHNRGTLIADRLQVVLRPESNRALSANADGIHAFGNRTPLHIVDCAFEGLGDDGINLHGRAGYIREQDTTTLLLNNSARTFRAEVGDHLVVLDPGTGAYRSEPKVVVGTRSIGQYLTEVTLDSAPEEVSASTNIDAADLIFNLDACSAGSTIMDNVFRPHRGRDIVLATVDIEVAGNTSNSASGNFITLPLNLRYSEGPIPSRILIRDNLVTATSRYINPEALPAISTWMAVGTSSQRYADSQAIEDITIQNNRFVSTKGPAIALRNTTSATVLGNWNDNRVRNKPVASASLYVANSARPAVRSYAVTDPHPETYAGVHFDMGSTGESWEDIRAVLGPGIPQVLQSP